MRSTPLCRHPDPDHGGGGKSNAGGPGTGDGWMDGGNGHVAGAMNDPAARPTDDPDRHRAGGAAPGELRQDIMPDLGQGGTPNPT